MDYYTNESEDEPDLQGVTDAMLGPLRQAMYWVGVPMAAIAVKKALDKQAIEVRNQFAQYRPDQTKVELKNPKNLFYDDDIELFDTSKAVEKLNDLKRAIKEEQIKAIDSANLDLDADAVFTDDSLDIDELGKFKEKWEADSSADNRRKLLLEYTKKTHPYFLEQQLKVAGIDNYQDNLDSQDLKNVAAVKRYAKLTKNHTLNTIINMFEEKAEKDGVAIVGIHSNKVKGTYSIIIEKGNGKRVPIELPFWSGSSGDIMGTQALGKERIGNGKSYSTVYESNEISGTLVSLKKTLLVGSKDELTTIMTGPDTVAFKIKDLLDSPKFSWNNIPNLIRNYARNRTGEVAEIGDLRAIKASAAIDSVDTLIEDSTSGIESSKVFNPETKSKETFKQKISDHGRNESFRNTAASQVSDDYLGKNAVNGGYLFSMMQDPTTRAKMQAWGLLTGKYTTDYKKLINVLSSKKGSANKSLLLDLYKEWAGSNNIDLPLINEANIMAEFSMGQLSSASSMNNAYDSRIENTFKTSITTQSAKAPGSITVGTIQSWNKNLQKYFQQEEVLDHFEKGYEQDRMTFLGGASIKRLNDIKQNLREELKTLNLDKDNIFRIPDVELIPQPELNIKEVTERRGRIAQDIRNLKKQKALYAQGSLDRNFTTFEIEKNYNAIKAINDQLAIIRKKKSRYIEYRKDFGKILKNFRNAYMDAIKSNEKITSDFMDSLIQTHIKDPIDNMEATKFKNTPENIVKEYTRIKTIFYHKVDTKLKHVAARFTTKKGLIKDRYAKQLEFFNAEREITKRIITKHNEGMRNYGFGVSTKEIYDIANEVYTNHMEKIGSEDFNKEAATKLDYYKKQADKKLVTIGFNRGQDKKMGFTFKFAEDHISNALHEPIQDRFSLPGLEETRLRASEVVQTIVMSPEKAATYGLGQGSALKVADTGSNLQKGLNNRTYNVKGTLVFSYDDKGKPNGVWFKEANKKTSGVALDHLVKDGKENAAYLNEQLKAIEQEVKAYVGKKQVQRTKDLYVKVDGRDKSIGTIGINFGGKNTKLPWQITETTKGGVTKAAYDINYSFTYDPHTEVSAKESDLAKAIQSVANQDIVIKEHPEMGSFTRHINNEKDLQRNLASLIVDASETTKAADSRAKGWFNNLNKVYNSAIEQARQLTEKGYKDHKLEKPITNIREFFENNKKTSRRLLKNLIIRQYADTTQYGSQLSSFIDDVLNGNSKAVNFLRGNSLDPMVQHVKQLFKFANSYKPSYDPKTGLFMIYQKPGKDYGMNFFNRGTKVEFEGQHVMAQEIIFESMKKGSADDLKKLQKFFKDNTRLNELERDITKETTRYVEATNRHLSYSTKEELSKSVKQYKLITEISGKATDAQKYNANNLLSGFVVAFKNQGEQDWYNANITYLSTNDIAHRHFASTQKTSSTIKIDKRLLFLAKMNNPAMGDLLEMNMYEGNLYMNHALKNANSVLDFTKTVNKIKDASIGIDNITRGTVGKILNALSTRLDKKGLKEDLLLDNNGWVGREDTTQLLERQAQHGAQEFMGLRSKLEELYSVYKHPSAEGAKNKYVEILRDLTNQEHFSQKFTMDYNANVFLKDLADIAKDFGGQSSKDGSVSFNVDLAEVLRFVGGNNNFDLNHTKKDLELKFHKKDFENPIGSIETNATKYRVLDINKNSMSGFAFKFLSNIRAYQYLNNRFEGAVPTEIKDLFEKNLHNLLQNQSNYIENKFGHDDTVWDKSYKQEISGTHRTFKAANSTILRAFGTTELGKKLGATLHGKALVTEDTAMDLLMGTNEHTAAKRIFEGDSLRKDIQGKLERLSQMDDDGSIAYKEHRLKLDQHTDDLINLVKGKNNKNLAAYVTKNFGVEASKTLIPAIENSITGVDMQAYEKTMRSNASKSLTRMYRESQKAVIAILKGGTEVIQALRHPVHTSLDLRTLNLAIFMDKNVSKDLANRITGDGKWQHLKNGDIMGDINDIISMFGDQDGDLIFFANKGIHSLNYGQLQDPDMKKAVIQREIDAIVRGRSTNMLHGGNQVSNIGLFRSGNAMAEDSLNKATNELHTKAFILKKAQDFMQDDLERLKLHISPKDNIDMEAMYKASLKAFEVNGYDIYHFSAVTPENLVDQANHTMLHVKEVKNPITGKMEKKWNVTASERGDFNASVQHERFNFTDQNRKDTNSAYKKLQDQYNEIMTISSTQYASGDALLKHEENTKGNLQKKDAGTLYKESTIMNYKMQFLKQNKDLFRVIGKNLLQDSAMSFGAEAMETLGHMANGSGKNFEMAVDGFVDSLLKVPKTAAEQFSLQLKHGGASVARGVLKVMQSLSSLTSEHGDIGLLNGKFDKRSQAIIDKVKNLDFEIELSPDEVNLGIKTLGTNQGTGTQVTTVAKYLEANNKKIQAIHSIYEDILGKGNSPISFNTKELDGHSYTLPTVKKDGLLKATQEIENRNLSIDKLQGSIPEGDIQTNIIRNSILEKVKRSSYKGPNAIGDLLTRELDSTSSNLFGIYRMFNQKDIANVFGNLKHFGALQSYMAKQTIGAEFNEAAELFYKHGNSSVDNASMVTDLDNLKKAGKHNTIRHYSNLMAIDKAYVDATIKDAAPQRRQVNYDKEYALLNSEKALQKGAMNLKSLGKATLTGTFIAMGINSLFSGSSIPDIQNSQGKGGEYWERNATRMSEMSMQPRAPYVETINPATQDARNQEMRLRANTDSYRAITLTDYSRNQDYSHDNISIKIR